MDILYIVQWAICVFCTFCWPVFNMVDIETVMEQYGDVLWVPSHSDNECHDQVCYFGHLDSIA